jgi:hypothetical protein
LGLKKYFSLQRRVKIAENQYHLRKKRELEAKKHFEFKK